MKIKDHLPTKEETALVQGWIDRDLRDRLMKKMKVEKVKIRDWLTAAAKAYLREK
jgi:hypothetical protein